MHTNRLIHETSPYLLQHAHNPVDWFAWGEEALQKAKAENKIILVSIGYAACHWCHVMERESFENEETAAIMNQYFINIKIDREERPDLDQVYMDAVQIISGSGGWPLNCFLTPDALPFYGGTYFPPVQAYNRSSWQEVLHAIHTAWEQKPQEILAQAENLTEHIRKDGILGSLKSGSASFSEKQLQTISQALLQNADKVLGGFGAAPKFPQTFSIQFLLRQHYFNAGKRKTNFSETEISPELQQALLSIDKMMYGGIYDQLAGGFARYSTDSRWLAPHFEKMLYDNALIINILSEAYQLTKHKKYQTVIEQTMQFIASEWQDDDGGFYSAYDADSEGEEGKYYTWEAHEVKALIKNEAHYHIYAEFYGIEEEGNWEETNILWIRQPLEEFCKNKELDIAETSSIIAQYNKALLVQRTQRTKPLLDDKKLFGWNALIITACCKAWAALGHDQYLQMAEKAAFFIEEKLRVNKVYHHNYKNGAAANPAFLDDLACYIQALCHLQECTGKGDYLTTAKQLTNYVMQAFSDQESPMFFYTPAQQTDIIIRKKDVYDGATASGNSIMAGNLFYLGTIFGDKNWLKRAELMLLQVQDVTVKYPVSFANWAQLLQSFQHKLDEIVIVGANSQAFAKEMLSFYYPNKLVQQTVSSKDEFPLLYQKSAISNQTTLYLCKEFICREPVFSVREIIETG